MKKDIKLLIIVLSFIVLFGATIIVGIIGSKTSPVDETERSFLPNLSERNFLAAATEKP